MSEPKKRESTTSSAPLSDEVQIRDSTKDLMQLSIAERERRVDASIESATKDTMLSGLGEDIRFQEVAVLLKNIERTPASFVIARDGTRLGYYYRPSQVGPAKAIYINFSLNTPMLAKTNIYLTKDYPVDSYVAFPRGYGPSSGKRGYSNRPSDYFKDMAEIIQHIKKNATPGIPIVIGGNALASALVTQFLKSKHYVPVDGMAACGMFYRGCARHGMHGAYKSFRAKASPLKIMLTTLTNGRLFGHSAVGRTSVNDDLYVLLPGITATFYGNMTTILLGKHPDKAILAANIPFYMIYGTRDELVDEKSAKIFDKVLARDPRSAIEYMDAGMVDMVIRGWVYVGRWIIKTFVEGRPAIESRPLEYRFMRALDGQWLQYHVISESKQPHCSVIYYGSASMEILQMLSKAFNVQVLHFIPREEESELSVLLDDLLQINRFVKANWPAEPVVLAGEGAYAGLITRYILWGNKIEVNGYLVLCPKLDPRTNSEYINDQFNGRGFYGEKSVKGAYGKLPDLDGLLRKLRAPMMMLFDERNRSTRTLRVMDRYADELSGPFTVLSSTAAEHVVQGNLDRIGAWIAGISSLSVSSSLSELRVSITKPLTLNDLEVIELLGVGSFGKVWLVKHHETNTFLALKVIEKSLVLARNQIAPVQNERRILKEVSSFPFIVPFVGTFQDRTRLFILMDYNIGGEIYALLGRKKRFPEDMARFYAAEMVLVLQYLHERKIVYRDLKSENTMIDSLGHIRVIDFGFAAFYDAERPFKTFCGSPYYLAPEIILGKPYGLECDYWSFGCWIYEMVTGSMPFSGRSQEQIYRRSVHAEPEYPSSLLSPEVTDLIKALLIKDPKQRLGHGYILDIKKHPWFRGVDWEKLRRREVEPPFQPEYSFAGDTSNFAYDQAMRAEKLEPMQPIDEHHVNDPFKDF